MRVLILLSLIASSLAGQQVKETDDDESPVDLAKVHRVYVDLLTGGDPALQMRDLLMSSLHAAKLVLVTEDEDKADAVLKGSADDTVYTQVFGSSEGLNAHSQLSLPDITIGKPGGVTNTKSAGRGSATMSVGENESHHGEERRHEAMATVRLVSKDGNVIWSTTQESLGGKFMGAAADVADKVARKLASDIRLARAKPQ